jgi:hypothetical protein
MPFEAQIWPGLYLSQACGTRELLLVWCAVLA